MKQLFVRRTAFTLGDVTRNRNSCSPELDGNSVQDSRFRSLEPAPESNFGARRIVADLFLTPAARSLVSNAESPAWIYSSLWHGSEPVSCLFSFDIGVRWSFWQFCRSRDACFVRARSTHLWPPFNWRVRLSRNSLITSTNKRPRFRPCRPRLTLTLP